MKVKAMKPDVYVSLKVSSKFLDHIRSTATYITSLKTEKDITKAIEKANNGDSLDQWENAYVTTILLIKGVEDEAIKHNLVKEVELED